MSKFKVGDEVVCIDVVNAEYGLDLFRHYKVSKLAQWSDPQEIFLEGNDFCWMERRFGLLSEWEKHQRKVAPETELELAKVQVKMLQEYKTRLRIVSYNAVSAYEENHTSSSDTHHALMLLKAFLEND